MRGASWVQDDVLEKLPNENIAVYAVWFNMVPTDRKDRWDPEVLHDRRVTHFWDDDQRLGRWITQNLPDHKHLGPIDWDSYYLFEADGRWEDSLPKVVANGTPIARETGSLERALDIPPTD